MLNASSLTELRRFRVLMPLLHFVILIAVCVKDVQDIIPKVGIVDFPLTLLASPILMNIDVSVIWIVLYYFLAGSFLWYWIGKGIDRLLRMET